MTQFLVQETSGSSTTTSLTLTLGTAATPGNGLVIAVSGFTGSTISGITIGGTGSLFTQVAATSSDDYNAQVWYCASGSVSSATIVITAGASGIIAWAYEITGTITPDQNEWTYNNTAQASWSSAATGTTLPIPEFIVGIGALMGTATSAITGPSTGGWTNESTFNGVVGGTQHYSGVSGYQQQAYSSATYDYSGTASPSSTFGAVTATFVPMSTQTGWGGYQFREHPSYTGISRDIHDPQPVRGSRGALLHVGGPRRRELRRHLPDRDLRELQHGILREQRQQLLVVVAARCRGTMEHHHVPHQGRGFADAHHPADRHRLADDHRQQHRGLDVHRSQVRPRGQCRVHPEQRDRAHGVALPERDSADHHREGRH